MWTVVNNWEDERLLVTRANEAINDELLVADLVEIGQYRPLADDVEHFEASHFTILQANRELVRLKNCSLATIHAIFATI